MSEILSWNEEQQQRCIIAETCATALAEHLPGTWERCDPHEYVVAIRSGDRYLMIQPERQAAVWRVTITAELPEGYRSHTRLEVQRTTVAARRPAEHIARQIQRRLLTAEYDQAIAEVHTALDDARDRRAALAFAVAELESLIPGAHRYPNDGESYTRFRGPDLLSGSFRVLSRAAEVDIDLDRVPIGLARDIAALIATHLDTETTDETPEATAPNFPAPVQDRPAQR
ncbi:hypothetical protein [Glycomyces salinus]|uniref:hypothetical protein n=1 Tax=Glycomyces salinus TaxID=980294 RepID=UPI0018ECE5F5|nr:hypothetical protein [Glycomyces salinus]